MKHYNSTLPSTIVADDGTIADGMMTGRQLFLSNFALKVRFKTQLSMKLTIKIRLLWADHGGEGAGANMGR